MTYNMSTTIEDLINENARVEDIEDIKLTIALAKANAPIWLAASNISLVRKRLALNTIIDAKETTHIFDEKITADFFMDNLRTTINDNMLDDELVEEICKMLLLGVNGYKMTLERGYDYEHLRQVRLGAENGVNVMIEIENDTPIDECIRRRIKVQNEVNQFLNKKNEEESSESVEESDSNE